MKNLLFGLIATVLFAFNGNAQNIEELKKSSNPYNLKGELFYNYLKEIQNSIEKNKKSLEEVSKEINSDNFEFKFKLNKDDVSLFEKNFKDKEINLQNIVMFENNVLQDAILSKNSNLLESIAILKWGFFYQEDFANRTLAGFEICLDRCLAKKAKALFQDGNWVDQAEFMLSGGAAFAWWVASCSWNCR
jgi:hypothetical protein